MASPLMRRTLYLLLGLVLCGQLQAGAGVPLGDELLAPAVPRPAPLSRPERTPQPAVFTTRSTLYATLSADRHWLATVEQGESGHELWLYPTAPGDTLPQRLLSGPTRLSAPSFSADGRWLAYVDERDDVKGDIWLFDRQHPQAPPQRLTGHESADGGPVFTPDSRALVYHSQRSVTAGRQLHRLELATRRDNLLPIGIDAAYANPAADGRRWVFVSRAGENDRLWLWDSVTAVLQPLTGPDGHVLYPVWESHDTLLCTWLATGPLPAAGESWRGQIVRFDLQRRDREERLIPAPLTAANLPALAPLPAGERIYFLLGRGGVGQLVTLPADGELPDQADSAAQWQLAQRLLQRQPADVVHARLACERVLARETTSPRFGVLARLALAALDEEAGNLDAAISGYAATVIMAVPFPEEWATAEIARLRLATVRACAATPLASNRRSLILATVEQLRSLAAAPASAVTRAQAQLAEARLWAEQLGDGKALLQALERYTGIADDAALPLALRAEADYRRARVLGRLEGGSGEEAALVAVVRNYPLEERWAESAVAALLERTLTSGSSTVEQLARLAALAEDYRQSAPRVAMAAWLRSGDLAYADQEWSRAKTAYRTVLENFAPLPTPTAAARLALAEILYREERYGEAIALYEAEMAGRSEDHPLYQLARAAYQRKNLASGEELYRRGEIAAARAVFLDLIRYDGRNLEAHRGYIKAVAAQNQTAELLALYRRLLAQYPDDGVLLYAVGLCTTYLPGPAALREADQLLMRAAERLPESEFPPQTRGYVAEVLETVHGEAGGLERAQTLYRRAWLLNRGSGNPANRANLELNLGNCAFLLGQYGAAAEHYRLRAASNQPFDNTETELLFQRRYGQAAFQNGERDTPLRTFERALQLVTARLDPAQPLERLGRLARRVNERLFTPPPTTAGALAALREQQQLGADLDRLGAVLPQAPPAREWEGFRTDLQQLLTRQQALLDGAARWAPQSWARHGAELQQLAAAVGQSLAEVPRLVETAAELHDRLGLAALEAQHYAQARQEFAAAFSLNQGLGRFDNLAANRRSASVAAYQEAQGLAGMARDELLLTAQSGFNEALQWLDAHPPTSKSAAARSGGMLRLGITVALAPAGATSAAFGFDAGQERRLIESYLARIAVELGEPRQAARLLNAQLQRYPVDNTKVAVADRYGVGLLSHRAAQVAWSLGERDLALAAFRRATSMALQEDYPHNAMLNLVNWGLVLGDKPTTAEQDEFLRQAAEVTRLAKRFRSVLPAPGLQRYRNDLGVLLLRLAATRDEPLQRAPLLQEALLHWQQALAEEQAISTKEAAALRGALLLNQAAALQALGLSTAAIASSSAALELSRQQRLPHLEWRALTQLGQYAAALSRLEALPPTAWDLAFGEVRGRFADYLTTLAQHNAEQAFAVLERLGEVERVQLLGRSLLALDDPAVRELLLQAAPQLQEISRLTVALEQASAAEQSYLRLRLSQQQALLDELLGTQQERLPTYYTLSGKAVLQLAAAAVQLAAAGPADEQRAAASWQSALEGVRKGSVDTPGGRLGRLLVAQAVEAIDVLERLPQEPLLRIAQLDAERWLVITLTPPEQISAEVLDQHGVNARLTAQPGGLAACETPERFATASVRSWGLSATQMLRAVAARKPFRRQVLAVEGGWPAGAPFTVTPLTTADRQLPLAQTLVLPGAAGLLVESPSGARSSAVGRLRYATATGQRQELLALSTAENLSLVLAPASGLEQTYALGQLLPFLGVPSLLVGSQRSVTPGFAQRYAQESVATARQELGAGWLLLGDWGLDATAAAQLGKNQFVGYGKRGVAAYNEQRYLAALALFESALSLAEEQPELAKHRATLRRLARDSAYAAGEMARALGHAEALVQLLAKEKPYSAEQADALLRSGQLLGNAEQFAAASARLEASVTLYAELGLGKEEATARSEFGVVLENAVDYAKAQTLFSDAAALRELQGEELPLAEQYRNLGRLLDLRLNRYAAAQQYYARAGDLYRAAGKPALLAATLLEQGRCQRLLGNFLAADDFYQQALAVLSASGDERTRLRIVLEQANNAWFQGRYQEAFELRDQVAKGAKANRWAAEEVMAQNTNGLLWWTLGDLPRARVELHRALELARTLPVRRDEVATTLNNLGLVQREAGDYVTALATLNEALSIDRQLGSRWAMAYDLRNLAQTRLRLNEPAAALPLLTEAEALARAIGDQVSLAKILLVRGEAALALQDPGAAEVYRQAQSLAETMLLREVHWRALFGLAHWQQQRGNAAEAITLLQQALDIIEGLRAEIRLDQLKDGFLLDKQAVYATLVGLLVDQGRGEEAFAVAERSRGRNLIDLLGRQALHLGSSGEQQFYARQRRLKEQLQEQETLATQAGSVAERARYTTALERLRAEYQDLLLEIERARPELLSLVQVTPATLAEIRQLLEPGVVLLSYYQLPERLLCWRIDRDAATLVQLPVTAATLAEEIATYRRRLQNLEPLEALSRQLFAQLLQVPLQGETVARSLGIIPHGSLHYLAFATLYDGRDYLIDRQPLFSLPSASVLRYTLARRSAQKNTRVLAIGNPELGSPALALPFAEEEAATLRWNFPEVTLLTRERATESWVRAHVGEFGIVHFASHGEFDPLNPLFSAVRLTADPAADGRLQADEVFGLQLRADLVVLSACQTGLGQLRGGDDVIGMNRAFLFAGTHALLSSLWRVSDVSTAILMKQFYREYRSAGKADSLRRAMLHVRGRYPHPGYWGAFVLVGDYL